MLKKLKETPFEPFLKVRIKFVTMKTAFLVAITMSGWSSDLTKLGCRAPFVWVEKNLSMLKFVPMSLCKQDRLGHNFANIVIPAFQEGRLLDPVWAVRLYLRRVQDRRNNLQSLLVTLGKGKRTTTPTAQTVALWISNYLRGRGWQGR